MAPLNVLMVGTGEYTTGWTGTGSSASDKKVGVVALVLFDLRRRGKVGSLSMVGTDGSKYPSIRSHLQTNISSRYSNLDVSFTSFPSAATRDPEAYKTAIDQLSPGDAITIFTPDTTHFPIAMYAIERGVHVLITKPAVKTLEHHYALLEAAERKGVFVYVEHHKRYDPAYADARAKARGLGDWGYFYAYMSQPKFQLETFRHWAGKESDISYYLNSHHVDVCASMVMEAGWRPTKVTASAARGTAEELGCVRDMEDTITLLTEWEKEGRRATAVFTSSWTAPQRAGVHSNQYFHYMASGGEIRINQGKRGYEVTSDEDGGLSWINPFYMSYAANEEGDFGGQNGYGYITFEKFVDACTAVNEGRLQRTEFDRRGLPTLRNTVVTTAILEAGRRSLDEERSIIIDELEDGKFELV